MDALLKNKAERLAIIDLGTNTFNLLIIAVKNGAYSKVFGTKVGVGLGLGGINHNVICEDAMLRGLETLKDFCEICAEYSLSKIVAFGTSAIRNANNQSEFIQRVKKEVNIDIEVISGQREAELIYKGVLIGLPQLSEFIIMDIGGGSTEFILGNSVFINAAASFEIGAARIFQGFSFSDPLTAADCIKIETYLDENVGDFFNGCSVSQLVGASGSFETFYELITRKTYPQQKYITLDKVVLMDYLEIIIHSTYAERMLNSHIISIRKKMAHIAGVKIRWIIRKLNIENIIISPFSLKEGIITELTH